MDKKYTILTDSGISKDNEHVRIALYANIGYFIQVVQMLEFNLRKLICYMKSVNEIKIGPITKERVDEIHKKYDEYYLKTYKKKFTLGKLKDELAKLNVFDSEAIECFEEINDYRIKVVHTIFQNNVVTNVFESTDNVLEYMMQRLVPMSNKTEELNKFVIKTITSYRDEFRKYLGS